MPGTSGSFPIYVMNTPELARRRAFMRSQLARLGARDVTWVLCGNRDEIEAFSPALRRCVYPCVQLNMLNMRPKWPLRPSTQPMSNGTLSLALKHKLAASHILTRRLPCALLLEDDAVLPWRRADMFWRALARIAALDASVPMDIFWLGSVRR